MSKKLYMVLVHGEEHPSTLDVYDKVEDAQHRADELELEAMARGENVRYEARGLSIEEAAKLVVAAE